MPRGGETGPGVRTLTPEQRETVFAKLRRRMELQRELGALKSSVLARELGVAEQTVRLWTSHIRKLLAQSR